MERSDYKSILHYLVLQPSSSGLSFDEFLLYFSNKDIGKLDLAIPESILRDAFLKRLAYFYNNNRITCFEELRMIANRHVSIEKCHAPEVSIGAFVFVYYKCLKVNFYFVIIDNKKTEKILSRCIGQSSVLSELCFKHISVNGLSSIASHCGPSLRILKAEVIVKADNNHSLELMQLMALQFICKACTNLIILDLEGFYL